MKIEFHAWPPSRIGGQRITDTRAGVLAIDTETGVAVFVGSERSQRANQILAEQRVQMLLANLPWSTSW